MQFHWNRRRWEQLIKASEIIFLLVNVGHIRRLIMYLGGQGWLLIPFGEDLVEKKKKNKILDLLARICDDCLPAEETNNEKN